MTRKDFTIVLRKATRSDVGAATALMKAAFAMWEPIGFDTASLNEAVVGSFLAQDGFMAEDPRGKAIGVICLNYEQPRIDGLDMYVARAHREDRTALLSSDTPDIIRGRRFAYIYSLAVDPKCSRNGIGRKCLELAEEEALRHDRDGLLLETGERGAWLVDWYRRVGFQLIGKYERAAQPLVFMMKTMAGVRHTIGVK